MKTYRIYLLRHGKCSSDSEDVVYYGCQTDVPLTEEGVELLRERRAEEPYPDADVFYCSPLTRCKQTMEILYPDQEYTVVENLKECNFGEFDGKSSNQLINDERFKEWLKGGTPPGGESTKEFVQRSVVCFAQIVEDMMRNGKHQAVIVAHGGTIMSILATCGIPEAPFSEWTCDFGGGYTLLVTPSIWMSGYKAEIIEKIL